LTQRKIKSKNYCYRLCRSGSYPR